MDNDFKPLLVNRETFLDYYKNKGLVEIINGLSWVTESFGLLDQLKKDPTNPSLKNRFIADIIPELKKEPVGEKAFMRLNEIVIYVKENNSVDILEDKIDILLHDLSKGYRILLQRYTAQ